MRKILLGLGAVSVMAVPAVVAVSCNEDGQTLNEYGKVAAQMKAVTPTPTTYKIDGVRKYFSLTWTLPTSFGISTSEVLNKIENEVRTHFNFSDSGDFNFTIGTYASTQGREDDHIEITLYTTNDEPDYTNGFDLTKSSHKKLVDDVIDYITKLS